MAERPADRPRHALDISRALADAVSALHAESLRSAA